MASSAPARHRRGDVPPGQRPRQWLRHPARARLGARRLLRQARSRWRSVWRPAPPQVGAGSPAIDICKRIRLCNLLALFAVGLLAPWIAVELVGGDSGNLPWEIGFLAGFVAALALNAARANRPARLLLLATANACVFAGALMFQRNAGGTLPFFGLIALPLLLFGPGEPVMLGLGTALPVALFAICETGVAARWLSIHPRPAPPWYFVANAATAFTATFMVPFFFYRANLRTEAVLERIGQEKLKRVIDSNLIGVVRGRLSGRIEDANDTFLSLLGYTRADLATGVLDLKALAPLAPFDGAGGREAPCGPGQTLSAVYERTFHRKDGSAVPALVGVALLDEGDQDDEVVGFVLDLTAQKEIEAEKAKLRESQEELRFRDLFNSVASHELKTPLAALMLNLHLLRKRLEREAPGNSGLRLQVERCQSSSARMGELIHALLDVTQIHDGKFKLTVHEMDIVDAVRRVVSAFEDGKIGDTPLIRVEAEGAVSAQLDSVRFDQVLTNLLSNALKYGAGKPIEVRVCRDQDADVARLEVIDHGPGIDPSMATKIFEPFQRGVSTDEPIPGLGLGLYVAKTIVEGHGGTINVETRLGQGSRFVVDFPCSPTHAPG